MKKIKILLTKKLNEIIEVLLNLKRIKKILLVVFLDVHIILLSVWASLSIRLGDVFVPEGNEFMLFLIAGIVGPIIFWQFRFYQVIIRFIDQKYVLQVFRSSLILTITWVSLIKYILPNYFGIDILFLPRSFPFIFITLLTFFLTASRFIVQYILNAPNLKRYTLSKVIIYGAGKNGKDTLSSLVRSKQFKFLGFLDPNKNLHGQTISGYTVLGDIEIISKIKLKHNNFRVLIVDPDIPKQRLLSLINECEKYNIIIRSIPDMSGLVNGMAFLSMLQDMTPGELLGRNEMLPKTNSALSHNKSKVILITGAGGSIGSELCSQLVQISPSHLILYDHSEYNLYSIKENLLKLIKEKKIEIKIEYILGTIEDIVHLEQVIKFYKVQTIYHAAAYKHVNLVEQNHISGIKNNIFGTLNLVKLARKFSVESFVLISTDKAVRPSTLMGKTKRVSELIVQAIMADIKKENNKTIKQSFSIVRFGNVLGSSGSVIPIFKKQIASGGPVTVTHREVTRYFMTTQEASQLVIESSGIAKGGEVFVLDMGQPVKIEQLAKKLIRLSGFNVYNNNEKNNVSNSIKIKYVGLNPGDKLHEELVISKLIKKTKIPKILKAEEMYIDWPILEKYLIKLEISLLKNDNKNALIIIDEMLK